MKIITKVVNPLNEYERSNAIKEAIKEAGKDQVLHDFKTETWVQEFNQISQPQRQPRTLFTFIFRDSIM